MSRRSIDETLENISFCSSIFERLKSISHDSQSDPHHGRTNSKNIFFRSTIYHHNIPYLMIWYHILWCDFISYNMTSHFIIWFHILCYDIRSYDMIPYHKIWYYIFWYDIISYDMTSYLMVLHHILWYHMIWGRAK